MSIGLLVGFPAFPSKTVETGFPTWKSLPIEPLLLLDPEQGFYGFTASRLRVIVRVSASTEGCGIWGWM
jgi:hypothetical protein